MEELIAGIERRLAGERAAHLAVVTLEVVILVHGHDPEDLFAALETPNVGK